ncbi:MAG: hypothetical protein ACJ736_15650 [Streptomyces sp.]
MWSFAEVAMGCAAEDSSAAPAEQAEGAAVDEDEQTAADPDDGHQDVRSAMESFGEHGQEQCR